MRIRNKRTGEYYNGFDGKRAEAVWTKLKIESTRINDEAVPAVIHQLGLLNYQCEAVDDECQ